MNDREDQVLLLGFIMIASHFFFGGQFKIIWGVVTTKPPKPATSKGPLTGIPGSPIGLNTSNTTNNSGVPALSGQDNTNSQHAPLIIPPIPQVYNNPPTLPPTHITQGTPLPWWDPRTWGLF